MLFSFDGVNDATEISVSQSDLITNIVERRWNIVESILCSYEFFDEIKTSNTTQDPTLLHLACSQAFVPYKVLENILKIYGTSYCLIEDEDGSLPIHIACSNKNIDLRILQLLFETSPDTGEQKFTFFSFSHDCNVTNPNSTICLQLM